ncbi:glutamate--cysteine ligase [Microbacterium sp. BK668]|uniref:carboxylate-amine ligase n=1 Tax=Microbacterium sp. BK668 TaxID=2512118 RepID=UPI001061C8B7|nr:glutamate--cysteine ligase [Microbacterium sp. BK668]TDN91144.1 carboxylate-amine ligase [Microbacterium sp. BK668]
MRRRTIGVEEEFLLVEQETGAPTPVAPALLAKVDESAVSFGAAAEMHQEMIELISTPHSDLEALRHDLATARSWADAAAASLGARLAPLATSPLPVAPHPSAGPRYQRLVERYGVTSARCLTCGMHVHVSVASAEEGVTVLDRIRGWLPVVRALAANSPFDGGEDTGHAGWRFVSWSQWPSSGPAEVYGDVDGYHRATAELLATGALLDEAMVYTDVRLSTRFPTVEVRVADVQLTTAAATAIAGLVRGLVGRAAEDGRLGEPPPDVSVNAIRLAEAEAALHGLAGPLVDPRTGRPAPAGEVVAALLDYAEPALAVHGDTARVRRGVEQLVAEGGGAAWQRRTAERLGSLPATVLSAADAAAEEARETLGPPVADSA